MKRTCKYLLVAALLNSAVFVVVSMSIGGDAVNGKMEIGKYYVGRGQASPVTLPLDFFNKEGSIERVGCHSFTGMRKGCVRGRGFASDSARGLDKSGLRMAGPPVGRVCRICSPPGTPNSPASAQKRERSGLWEGEIGREAGEFGMTFSDESDQVCSKGWISSSPDLPPTPSNT